MSEQPSDRIWSGIDISKTIAGALAAVCAAVAGSFLGVAGTLVGAVLASIVASVGTEVYHRSLNKGAKKLRTLTPAFVKTPAAVGTPAVAAATQEESPSHTVPDRPRRQLRWARVAVLAGALFVLAMGTLTVVELALGKSVASTVGNSTGARTTFGGVLDPGGDDPAPAPTGTTPDRETPATEPASDPTAPAPAGTTAPAEEDPTTPVQTPPAADSP